MKKFITLLLSFILILTASVPLFLPMNFIHLAMTRFLPLLNSNAYFLVIILTAPIMKMPLEITVT